MITQSPSLYLPLYLSFYKKGGLRCYAALTHCPQGQPPPEGDDSSQKKDEQGEDKKQKENTAYAKKMVLRLAGIMGLGSTVGIVYLFGEFACCFLSVSRFKHVRLVKIFVSSLACLDCLR